ncbi:MAG: 23S rRNA (adenine(2503)-C(2))-methyltransferase RlmN [Clostridia bacterium]|nr:23S rRNA (adenine(2503)-C(2))-methyltransferase RlmN [Clostridia bacterium]MBR0407819.1 23S rRNA (adenine(2503)-C(2))-methyltransferase RlmN [Clostridia bacterium]
MENKQIQWMGLYPEELKQALSEMGEKPFRAGQVFAWLHKGARFEEMTNLSLALREKLRERGIDQPVAIRETRVSKLDGTEKFLFALPDGNCVEGVLMRYHYGATLCISTQVGCKMGCRFCASTLDGCVRNLTAAEMLGEVQCANRTMEGERVHNIVLMGSGEPMDNYDEVVRFLRLVSHPDGLNIGLRHISVSTCGLVPRMKRFAEEGLPVTLSLSLHAPNDEIRRQIMPVAQRYTIEETLDACRYYIEKTGRRVVFEYALIDHVNASPECAEELAGRLRGMQCHVNLIPLNTVKERNLFGVTEKQVQDFLSVLERRHISATRRREMGDDIEGACGQLRKKVLREGQS